MKKEKDQISAFLGKDTEFDGTLKFQGAIRIDGRFKGEIITEGTLIVGETGVVESDIQVSRIVVSGEVRGSVAAREKIEIHAPGKVFGTIKTPVLTIEEGVIFQGSCEMEKEREVASKKVTRLQDESRLVE